MPGEDITLHVSGFRELNNALDEQSKAVAKSAMREILLESGDITAVVARSISPVGHQHPRKKHKPGRLKERGWAVGTKLDHRQAAAEKEVETTSYVKAYIGAVASIPEAIFEEFGTKRGVKAFPTLRPAWDTTKNKVLSNIVRLSWGIIQATAEKFAVRQGRKEKL